MLVVAADDDGLFRMRLPWDADLDVDVGDALMAEMEREYPDSARLLKPRIESNRRQSRRFELG